MPLEIHPVVQHADDYDALLVGLIEDDMRLLTEASKTRRDVFSASAQFRVGA